ncbi:hypothetical protein Q787_03225 [Ornithobacterium rhinotracheale H06-030791]|nr:hypothetical protein Q785_03350 [Ornithobacterium rhinotracheale ORT-UMN 88]KGB67252.1 hypothetical protein Q787_03225 [Ornithobacterium rhinotracheale H06-030791]
MLLKKNTCVFSKNVACFFKKDVCFLRVGKEEK